MKNRTTTGTAPFYLNSLIQTYVPSTKHKISFSDLYHVCSLLNDLTKSTRAAESEATFKKLLKTHLFWQHLI